MVLKFPFESKNTPIFGEIFRPVADVLIWSKNLNDWISITMLVDSGADYTVLPFWLVEKLGINISVECIKTDTEGVGGKANIFLLRGGLQVKLGQFEKRIPVGFIKQANIPPILGRLKFLEAMKVTFLKHETIFRV